MLTIEGLDVFYGRVQALRAVSLTVARGELVTIVGPNGSGKSTLLRTITGLVSARAGAIVLDGTVITALATEDVAARGIALVPEGRDLFGSLTVRDNLLLGGWSLRKSVGRAGRTAELDRVVALFPALAPRLGQAAMTLSGGEQQMVAIGRALMARPRLLLLDEPSVGLAPLVIREIFRTLAALKSEGLTILLVEQNARAAFRIAERGYVLAPGGVISSATSNGRAADDAHAAYGLRTLRQEAPR
jgi:branched-chain amino acid transport system ATP-binding protein